MLKIGSKVHLSYSKILVKYEEENYKMSVAPAVLSLLLHSIWKWESNLYSYYRLRAVEILLNSSYGHMPLNNCHFLITGVHCGCRDHGMVTFRLIWPNLCRWWADITTIYGVLNGGPTCRTMTQVHEPMRRRRVIGYRDIEPKALWSDIIWPKAETVHHLCGWSVPTLGGLVYSGLGSSFET